MRVLGCTGVLLLGQALKEVCCGLALCQTISEAVPVGAPMLPCARDNRWPALFHCVHCPHGRISPQRPSSCLPKCGSRNVSSTATIKEDWLSLRVHAE